MTKLEDYRAPTKVRLAALWASTMFCYVYEDYFVLYGAGTLADMNKGIMGPLGPATPGILIAVSMMMALPSLMIILTLVFAPRVCRWVNIVLGLAYTGIMAISIPGSQPFYVALGIIEMTLTMAIALVAFRWPRIADPG